MTETLSRTHQRISKLSGLVAVITPFWFIAVYLTMSSMRPEYSHATKAISELGSVDAPNLWYWNVLGFMVTGLFISLLGIGLATRFLGRSKVPGVALVASGLLMVMAGAFPADLENRTSLTTVMHAVGSLGSFAAFLVAGFWYPVRFLRMPTWRATGWLALLAVILSIASGFLRSGDAPGLGQKLGFAAFLAWVFLVGLALFRDSEPE